MEAWNIGCYATSFVLVVTSLILLYLYLEWKCRYWQRLGIKSPTFFETILSLPRTFSQPHNVAVNEAYKKYGRVFGIYSPMRQLFVAEPELIKHIVVKDFHIFRNRTKHHFNKDQELLQNMLSVLCNEDWKRVRCVMSPTFSSSKMRKMANLVNECAKNAAKFFEGIADKNEEVDIKPYFGSFAMDVIATTAFATKMDSLHDPDNEFLANARKINNKDVSFIKILFISVFPRIAKLLRIEMFDMKPFMYFRGIVMQIIEERQKTKVRGHDFLQLMMDARDGIIETATEESKEAEEQPHKGERPKHRTISFEEIVSQCVLFFSAGHDTTSSTLSNVAYNLALNPDYQDRLAKEIQETWEKNGAMDFDTVSKMPYLDAVIYETLRKDSTATRICRRCSEDYALGNTGVTLPEGSVVSIPVYSMHKDPEWFPNPDKFDPERFMPENKHLVKPFTYMPFGDGPRNCIGMRFAVMVMKLCLSHLLKDIKFVATEETRKPLEYYNSQGVLLAKQVQLKVERRKFE